MEPQRKDPAETPEGRRRIAPSEWRDGRWGWLEAVRRDGSLNPMARLLAHELAVGWANRHTQRCDPSIADLAANLATSDDTIQRAMRALVAAKWIVKEAGRGPGAKVQIVFLERANVVPLRVGSEGGESRRFAGQKGGKSAGHSDPKEPQICTERAANLHPPYIEDQPSMNQSARAPARGGAPARGSANPMVAKSAERAVARFREGAAHAFDGEPDFVIRHIIAQGLLTTDEMAWAGFAGEGGAA